MNLLTKIKRLFVPDLKTTRDPFSLGSWDKPRNDAPPAGDSAKQSLPKPFEGDAAGEVLAADLEQNLRWLRQHFSIPANQGLTIHPVTLPTTPPTPAAVVYLQGMVDSYRMNLAVFEPLLSRAQIEPIGADPEVIFRQAIREGQGALYHSKSDLCNAVLSGSVAVLIDGHLRAVTVRLEGWPMRAIERSTSEATIRGPQESFTEDLRTNITQIRRRLRSPQLIVEVGQLGRYSRTDIAVIYLQGLANEKVLGELRRRLDAIDVDFVADSGSVTQFIEDHSGSTYPTILATERPDRTAAQISEGFVAVIVDNDPHALILPITMPSLLHNPEDVYLRWPAGSFMRVTRVAAYYVSLLMPALYIALVNFRQEMVPTPLLLAISHSRETVPFSTVAEVLLMEGAFDLIYEATLRVPTVVGPTIGIVGSLILGQAAVMAGVISPILIIITAATALSSFAIPNYDLQISVRLWRFFYMGAASVLGLGGVVLLHTMYVAYVGSINSFGVPYLSPIAPPGRQKDSLLRAPMHEQNRRPGFVRPQRLQQQDRYTRPWAPESGVGGRSEKGVTDDLP